ncbi:hypothetical protein HYY75_04725, partial [bacterium]|nr:hypothetical protein [bacterium]
NENLTELSKLVETVMDKWLSFSNKFSINPPEFAKADPAWRQKMAEAAERVGEIRKKIDTRNYHDAHNAVLSLSQFLIKFFDSSSISPLKKSFLIGAELFSEMELSLSASDTIKFHLSLASTTQLMATYTPLLSTDSRQIWNHINYSLKVLNAMVSTSPVIVDPNATNLLKNVTEDYLDLRTRILVSQWFPQISIPVGSFSNGENQ